MFEPQVIMNSQAETIRRLRQELAAQGQAEITHQLRSEISERDQTIIDLRTTLMAYQSQAADLAQRYLALQESSANETQTALREMRASALVNSELQQEVVRIRQQSLDACVHTQS